LLIDHYQRLEREEREVLDQGLVLRGARDRIGPILTTATALGAAVLPLVAFGNIPGLEILHPMAVAVVGGLVTAAVMSLFVLPALYLRFASPQPQPEMPQGSGSEHHA
jgi:Cu/Ag efflux pump CusA